MIADGFPPSITHLSITPDVGDDDDDNDDGKQKSKQKQRATSKANQHQPHQFNGGEPRRTRVKRQ